MIDARDADEIERIIRTVAEREVEPWFGRLTATDIVEKAPGDLVTVADRAAEAALTVALEAVVPGSVTVGEEAVAADPTVQAALDGDAPVWVIDPIDGTHNFATDNPRFAMLVALAHRANCWRRGRTRRRWISWRPPGAARGPTSTASGCGCAPAPDTLRHLDVCTPQQKWWTGPNRARFNGLSRAGVSLCFFDTSGLEYIELAAGRRSAMIVTWEFPWDHAAGVLLHAEAGGVAIDCDGRPFRLAGGNALPFVVAPDAECAARVHAAMAGVVTPS